MEKESTIDLTPYQQFIHKSRYARYIASEGRRENWRETVKRYIDYFVESAQKNNHYTLTPQEKTALTYAILHQKVMPSMRAMMTAGLAAQRENIAVFNCAYVAIDDPYVFAEALYILMNGTGLGFSCERQAITKLPRLPKDPIKQSERVHTIGDSKRGWADAYWRKNLT